MVLRPAHFGRRSALPLLLAVLLLFAAAAPAQSAPEPEPQSAPQAAPPSAEEHHISPEEAKELLNSVDEVLKFDSQNTGLPIRQQVKRALAGREQVENYIQSRLRDDQDAERLRSAASVLKKFGLLPRGFNLESFLVKLMGEQVAGYYDTDSKTVYLLNWLPPETQQPVLAHELVHALQDQNFGIEQWIRKVDVHNGSAEKQIASDEAMAARHAVVEGQAMAAMVDFLLTPIHGSLVNSPVMAQALERGMLEGSDSPVMGRSPLYLKQLLLFPYTYGLNFERELLVQKGKDGAYHDVFKHPPQDTRQIMQPETYLAGEKSSALHVPKFDSLLGPGYQPFDVGSIGEFDVSVMVQQFGSAERSSSENPESNHGGPASATNQARATNEARVNPRVRPAAQRSDAEQDQPQGKNPPPLWTHWRAGYYYAARLKTPADPPAGTEVPASDVALVFVSRWDTSQAAADFAAIYRASVPKRYSGVSRVPAAAADCTDCSKSTAADTMGAFQTSEGPVSIEVNKKLVIAIESFQPAVAAKIRAAVLKAGQ